MRSEHTTYPYPTMARITEWDSTLRKGVFVWFNTRAEAEKHIEANADSYIIKPRIEIIEVAR